jgi:predicted branched-subunit amino acid permease
MDTAEFRAGARAALPILLGLAPFALVSGVAAVRTGLSPVQAMGLSVVVFAGASQLAALDLLGRDASLGVIVVTAAVINLRLLMYSASIAPHFRTFAARWKAVCAYLLTDQAYAVSLARFDAGADDGASGADAPAEKRAFYLGIAATLWAVWQIGTAAGIALGAGVPDRWGLEFAVPLVFLAVLVPALVDRATVAAGVVGGGVALAGAGLPLNLGLLAGASVGIAAGMAVEGAGG